MSVLDYSVCMSNSKLVLWLVGILGSIALTGGGMWMTHVDLELSRVEGWHVENTDRISRVESKVDVSLEWLARIEGKLDRLSDE